MTLTCSKSRYSSLRTCDWYGSITNSAHNVRKSSKKITRTDLMIRVPVNCSFEIDDAEDPWLFSHKFDYIHARGVVTCFKDVRQVIESAFEFLEPGGYLEFKDGIFPPSYAEPPPVDSAFVRWITIILQEAEKAGRPWTKARYYADYMRNAGFIDVEECRSSLSAGPWPEKEKDKQLGSLHLTNWLQVIDALTPKMFSHAGWGDEEIKVLAATVKSELNEGKIKVYNEMIGVWGRKPSNIDTR
jgi:Methyltransferase domain